MANDPTAQPPALNDILKFGDDNGMTPEQQAAAVQKWRQQMMSFGENKLASSNPDLLFKGNSQMDNDVANAVNRLRASSVQDWANKFYGDDRAAMQQFVTTYQKDPAAAYQDNPQATDALNGIMQNPAFRSRTLNSVPYTIPGQGGTELGVYQMQPSADGKSMNVLMHVRPQTGGQATGQPVSTMLKVPIVTDDDVQSAQVKAMQIANTAEEQRDGISQAQSVGWEAPGTADSSLAQLSMQQAARVDALNGPNGKNILQQEAVQDAFKKDPIAAQAGQMGLGEDLMRGIANIGAGINMAAANTFGSDQQQQEARETLNGLANYYPGTTAPGKGAQFLRSTAEMAPTVAAALNPVSNAAMLAGTYGQGVNEALNQSDAALAQAEKFKAAGNDDLASQFTDLGNQIKNDARLYGGTTTATYALMNKLMPKANTALGRAALSGTEWGAINGVNGQIIKPALIGQRDDPMNILQGALLGFGMGMAREGAGAAYDAYKSGQTPAAQPQGTQAPPAGSTPPNPAASSSTPPPPDPNAGPQPQPNPASSAGPNPKGQQSQSSSGPQSSQNSQNTGTAGAGPQPQPGPGPQAPPPKGPPAKQFSSQADFNAFMDNAAKSGDVENATDAFAMNEHSWRLKWVKSRMQQGNDYQEFINSIFGGRSNAEHEAYTAAQAAQRAQGDAGPNESGPAQPGAAGGQRGSSGPVPEASTPQPEPAAGAPDAAPEPTGPVGAPETPAEASATPTPEDFGIVAEPQETPLSEPEASSAEAPTEEQPTTDENATPEGLQPDSDSGESTRTPSGETVPGDEEETRQSDSGQPGAGDSVEDSGEGEKPEALQSASQDRDPRAPVRELPEGESERVMRAAVLKDGNVYSSRRPTDGYDRIEKTNKVDGGERGFLTNTGRFVTPTQAAEISGIKSDADGLTHEGLLDARPRVLGRQSDESRIFQESHPILTMMGSVGGLMSKSTAKKRGGEFWAQNKSLWDDAPRLAHPTHNAIYSKTGGVMPDQMAQALQDHGVGDGTVEELWKTVDKESRGAVVRAAQERDQRSKIAGEEAAAAKTDKAQQKDFDRASTQPEPGKKPVDSWDLQAGDTVHVDGEPMKVHDLENGDVLLEDGSRFGSRVLSTGEQIWVEKHEKAAEEEDPFALDTQTDADIDADRQRGALEKRAAAPLSGTSGEHGTPDMFDPTAGATPLFSQPLERQEPTPQIMQNPVAKNQATVDMRRAIAHGDPINFKMANALGLKVPEGYADVADAKMAAQQSAGSKTDHAPEEAPPQVPRGGMKIRKFLNDVQGKPGHAGGFIDLGLVMRSIGVNPQVLTRAIQGQLGTWSGETFPKTTLRDRVLGEKGARWISSKIAAPYIADVFTQRVAGDDPDFDYRKFGTALSEDNLRSVKDDFQKAGETTKAAAVSSLIGSPNSPFATEAEYQAYLADPAIQQAIDRHKTLWDGGVEPMYKQAMMIDAHVPLPTRGLQTGARVNLYGVDPANPTGRPPVNTVGPGNLGGTMQRKSPFGRAAKGSGQYNTDYRDMMNNTFGKQLEVANKNSFEKHMVDTGNAVIDDPGETPTLADGEKTVPFPLVRRQIVTDSKGKTVTIPVSKNLYVRESLAGEYQRGSNVERWPVPAVLKGVANVMNKTALAGLTDATVHLSNLATVLFTRPIGNPIMNALMAVTGRADIPYVLTRALLKAMQNGPEVRAQMARLAEIGAMREDYASRNPAHRLIMAMDRAVRLVMDDSYTQMARMGLVPDTETGRREFVNQVGQYNKRAQGDFMTLFRNTVAPFATAGRNFNVLGLRSVFLNPGASGTSMGSSAVLRGNMLAKWIGAAVLIGATNYLLTKDKGGGVLGRPGVKVGHIDSGLTDANGRPETLNALDLVGLGRGLRVLGIKGAIDSARNDLPGGVIVDSAARDIINSNISPFAGPIVHFGFGLANASPAINVGQPYPIVPPGQSQLASNFANSIKNLNPIVGSYFDMDKPGATKFDWLRRQLPRFMLSPSNPPDMMANYPEIVHKAQLSAYVDDVVHHARKMEPDAREKYLESVLGTLNDQDQAYARKQFQWRRVR